MASSFSIFFLILALYTTYAEGTLKCYTCSVGENDFDTRCVTDPASVEIGNPITNCNKKYCTSMRQEYIDPKGKVASMVRGCEDKPLYLNQIIEDATYRYYFRSCQNDLCNNGTGLSTGTTGVHDQDTGGTIYTRGIGNYAVSLKINLPLFVLILVVLYYVL